MIKIKEIKIRVGLEYLLIKAYQHFLEDLIFHLMVNYSYFPLVNGKEQTIPPPNTVHFCTVKISSINLQ